MCVLHTHLQEVQVEGGHCILIRPSQVKGAGLRAQILRPLGPVSAQAHRPIAIASWLPVLISCENRNAAAIRIPRSSLAVASISVVEGWGVCDAQRNGGHSLLRGTRRDPIWASVSLSLASSLVPFMLYDAFAWKILFRFV